MEHPAPQPGMNLLIVDDDRSIRSLIAKVARGWGYLAEECDSAESALERLAQVNFNIVLTDIKMGKMDGLAFAERLRATMPTTAVIIMTGFPSVNTAQQSQDIGAVYYMQKPLDFRDLGTTLKIAAGWNISVLVDRAARRLLALSTTSPETGTKSLKQAIIKRLVSTEWMADLRNFSSAENIESTLLYQEFSPLYVAGHDLNLVREKSNRAEQAP